MPQMGQFREEGKSWDYKSLGTFMMIWWNKSYLCHCTYLARDRVSFSIVHWSALVQGLVLKNIIQTKCLVLLLQVWFCCKSWGWLPAWSSCPRKVRLASFVQKNAEIQRWAHATTIAAFWHRCKAPKVAISRLGAKYIADATI